MSKIGGYTLFDVGFQKTIYEKAKPENKRTDKKLVEKYGAAQKTASKQPELEKSGADQKKRIEQAREDKKAQKKEDEKEAKAKKLKEQQEDKVKRSVVRGDTADELIKNIQAVNWDKVAEEVRPKAGVKMDLESTIFRFLALA